MYHRYCSGQIRESFIMKLYQSTYESTLRYVDQMCWIKTIIKLQSLCYLSDYPEKIMWLYRAFHNVLSNYKHL
jgi:hypothetical protein